MTLFTAKNIHLAFPWIDQTVVNYRVKAGLLRIGNPSTGTGIPNLFTLPELVHCAVFDELMLLGVHSGREKSRAARTQASINYREPGDAPNTWRTWGSPDPLYVDFTFYERHEYRVIIVVTIRHDFLPGTNIPRKLHSRSQRFYHVQYSPEADPKGPYLEQELSYWYDPRKAQFNQWIASKAFIRVRQLYELAAKALAL